MNILRTKWQPLSLLTKVIIVFLLIALVFNVVGILTRDSADAPQTQVSQHQVQEKKPLQSNTEGQKTADTSQNTENEAVIQENKNTEPVPSHDRGVGTERKDEPDITINTSDSGNTTPPTSSQDAQNEPQTNEPVKTNPEPTAEVKPPPVPQQEVVQQPEPVPQPSLLAGLVIEPEYRGGGYKRYSWRSSVDKALKWKQEGCKWAYYSATTTPHCLTGVDREHLVAFKEAFESGLYLWNEGKQREFYNTASNLYVMPSGENRSKSDKDVAEWKPQDTAVWCRYATENIQIKRAWGLSVDKAEYDILSEMLGYC